MIRKQCYTVGVILNRLFCIHLKLLVKILFACLLGRTTSYSQRAALVFNTMKERNSKKYMIFMNIFFKKEYMTDWVIIVFSVKVQTSDTQKQFSTTAHHWKLKKLLLFPHLLLLLLVQTSPRRSWQAPLEVELLCFRSAGMAHSSLIKRREERSVTTNNSFMLAAAWSNLRWNQKHYL